MVKGYGYYIYNVIQIFTAKKYKGWGRKKTGQFACWCKKKFNGTFILYEDGFIRSIGLGVSGSPSFSLVEDDVGIYYDATAPSKLENILNTYNFDNDTKLMKDASKAIGLILKYNISKYNYMPSINNIFIQKYTLLDTINILIIAQTAGDTSLEYGMIDTFTTNDMIESAIEENPEAKIFLKIHPDVISGKKKSDIDIEKVKKRCIIIEEDVNPISLLKYFTKVYTKTSGMGFEALLCGCECVCFGMPYYAGWGVTTDKSSCIRRTKKRTIEEIFAAAYILYTHYYNPYTRQKSNIFDTIKEIRKQHLTIRYKINKKEDF